MKPAQLTLTFAVVLALATHSRAGVTAVDSKAPVPTIANEAWGGTLLGAGVKSNGDFTEGSMFLTHPVYDTVGKGGTTKGSILLIEPYGTWGDGGEAGGSLGIIYRHLFSNQSNRDARSNRSPGFLTEGVFIGANLFIDYDHTKLGSNFWQVAVGLEAGTRYLELHANYYIPTSDPHFLGRQTDIFRTQSRHTSTSTHLGAPFVDGNGNTVQNRFQTRSTTTRTSTVRRVTEFWEEPLEGWDVELSMLLPRVDKWADVRLVGAYYSYHGDFLHAVDISGWRAGVEIRPVKALVISAMWYQKNQLYRDHWLIGARLEIPLDRPIYESFSSGYRPLPERLYEPARRKNSAITSTPLSNTTTTTTTGSSTSSTQSQSQILLATPPPPPPPPSPQYEEEG